LKNNVSPIPHYTGKKNTQESINDTLSQKTDFHTVAWY